MRRIHIAVFGCQMNKLDAELAAESLAAAGHEMVDDPADADCLLWMTCSVRDHAERRVLSRVEQTRARKGREPGLLLGILGCMGERRGAALFERLPHLDFIAGTRAFPRLPDILARAERGVPVAAVGDGADPDAITWTRSRHRGLQAFVAVMRGCDNRCAYCVVPATRGPERSRDPEGIVAEVRGVVAAGAREVTLLGQNVDAYGKGTADDFPALLARLEREIPPPAPDGTGLARLRFVTSHPRDITPRLADVVAAHPRIAPAFHMPAQSGSDAVLRRMGRGYTRAAYEDKLAMLRGRVPGATVASDFIVGFPGETDVDFAATEDLVRRAGFQNSFLFKYSPRPGTRAETWGDDVPDAVKRERHKRLLAAQTASAKKQTAALRGARDDVLVEGFSPRDRRRLAGRTPGNRIVVFDAPPDADAWIGRVVPMEIAGSTALTLYGIPAGKHATP